MTPSPIEVLRDSLYRLCEREAGESTRDEGLMALADVEKLVEAAHAVVYRYNESGVVRTYRQQDDDLRVALRPFAGR